ncbi:MAG: helix-turn-helix domain-containing protein, partial [Candidatus Pacearchaeota archaeon]
MTVFCRKKLNIPECLGKKLKTLREEKNLTLDEISKITHIEKKHLINLEQGNYNLLPNTQAHCQIYIKKYCQAINIDCKSYLEDFEKETKYRKIFEQKLNKNYYKTQIFTITI